MQELRKDGIACELYHELSKLDKQFKYAEKKNITYAVIIGSKEIEQNCAILKNLSSGNQENIPFNQLAEKIK
jgi:histidyl-tRNA synthetase